MRHRRSTEGMLVLVSILVATCGDPSHAGAGERPASETVDQASDPAEPSPALPQPVDLEDAVRPLRLEVPSEFGYLDAKGELIVDLVEGEYRFLQLLIEDAEGRPVRGVLPKVTTERDSRFKPMGDEGTVSDRFGHYWFGLIGGGMGDERVDIVAGDAATSVILNIISKLAERYGWLEDIEGVLDWNLLLEADIEWDEQRISATFPDEVLAKNGQTVKLAGFMLPLETTFKQSRVLLVSNPPGCFFHVPGGPAGGVEVLAKKPLEVIWDPVVMEGRFEALETDETGVVYRLHEARMLPVPQSSGQ